MKGKVLHSADWRAVSAVRTQDAQAAGMKAARIRADAKVMTAAGRMGWRDVGSAMISRVSMACFTHFG